MASLITLFSTLSQKQRATLPLPMRAVILFSRAKEDVLQTAEGIVISPRPLVEYVGKKIDEQLKSLVADIALSDVDHIQKESKKLQQTIRKSSCEEAFLSAFDEVCSEFKKKQTTGLIRIIPHVSLMHHGKKTVLPLHDHTVVASKDCSEKELRQSLAQVFSPEFFISRLTEGQDIRHVHIGFLLIEEHAADAHVMLRPKMHTYDVFGYPGHADDFWGDSGVFEEITVAKHPETGDIERISNYIRRPISAHATMRTFTKGGTQKKKRILVKAKQKPLFHDVLVSGLGYALSYLERTTDITYELYAQRTSAGAVQVFAVRLWDLPDTDLTVDTYALRKSGVLLGSGIGRGNAIAAGPVLDDKQDTGIWIWEEGDAYGVPPVWVQGAVCSSLHPQAETLLDAFHDRGIPCVLVPNNIASSLKKESHLTVDTTDHAGRVLRGALPFERIPHDLKSCSVPAPWYISSQFLSPVADFAPFAHGIGPVSLSRVLAEMLPVHPNVLLAKTHTKKQAAQLKDITEAYRSSRTYLIECMAEIMAELGACSGRKPILLQLDHACTTAFDHLDGGPLLEEEYMKAVGDALHHARVNLGYSNIIAVLPSVRTPDEAEAQIARFADAGIVRGHDGLTLYMECAVPSNVILIDDYLSLVDGVLVAMDPIGSHTLGIDALDTDAQIRYEGEEDLYVTLLNQVIQSAKRKKKFVAVYGSLAEHPEERLHRICASGADAVCITAPAIASLAARSEQRPKETKKRDRKFLSTLFGVASIAAAIMLIGAGCGGYVAPHGAPAPLEASPRELRERIEEKTRQEIAEEQAKQEQHHSQTASVSQFAVNLDVVHDTNWSVVQMPGVVLFVPAQPSSETGSTTPYVELSEVEEISEELPFGETPDQLGNFAAARRQVVSDGVVGYEFIVDHNDGDSYLVIRSNDPTFYGFLEQLYPVFPKEEQEEVGDDEELPQEDSEQADASELHSEEDTEPLCIQVITYAQSSPDDTCEAFSTPCDVPEDWVTCAPEGLQ